MSSDSSTSDYDQIPETPTLDHKDPVLIKKSEEKQKWETIQRKAFNHWINGYLAMEDIKITDVIDGFRDGVNLIIFLQLLTGEKITQGYTKKPKMRVHKITNCYIALKFLEDQEVRGLTVSAEDIVDASERNLKYILGFCWMLLRRFQNVPKKKVEGSEHEVNQFENDLLSWISDSTEQKGLEIEGFSSLHDGKAILALLEKYDKNIVNFDKVNFDDPKETVSMALRLAEEHLGVPADLLEVDELVDGTASDKNLVLYSTLLYNSFQNKHNLASKESLVSQIKDLEQELKESKAVLEEKKKVVKEITITQKESQKEMEKVQESKTQLETFKEEKQEEWTTEKKQLKQRLKELQENYKALQDAVEGKNTELEEKTEERKAERDQLIALKEQLEEKVESLAIQKEETEAKFSEARDKRQEMEDTVSKDQERVGGLIASLAKQMTQHVEDMNVWKVFLKQKTVYSSETIQDLSKAEMEEMDYDDAFNELEKKLEAENEQLRQIMIEQVQIMEEARKTMNFNRERSTGNKSKRKVRASSSAKPNHKSAALGALGAEEVSEIKESKAEKTAKRRKSHRRKSKQGEFIKSSEKNRDKSAERSRDKSAERSRDKSGKSERTRDKSAERSRDKSGEKKRRRRKTAEEE